MTIIEEWSPLNKVKCAPNSELGSSHPFCAMPVFGSFLTPATTGSLSVLSFKFNQYQELNLSESIIKGQASKDILQASGAERVR